MYNAGVQVRLDAHQGINHEKAILLRGTGMTIFGSSNWTSPSTDSQREHNMFTTQAVDLQLAGGPVQAQVDQRRPATRRPSRSCRCRPTRRSTTCRRTAPPASPTTGVAPVVLRRPVGAQLRHLLRHDAESAAARGRQASRPEPVQRPTIATTRCRSCSRARRYYWKIVSKTMARPERRRPGVELHDRRHGAEQPAADRLARRRPANGATFTAPATITADRDRRRQRRHDRQGRLLRRHHADRHRHPAPLQRHLDQRAGRHLLA